MNPVAPIIALALLAPAALTVAAEPSPATALERELRALEDVLPGLLKERLRDEQYARHALEQQREVIRQFRQRGEAGPRSAWGHHLLETACMAGRLELARELLAAGADPNPDDEHPGLVSPLASLCSCNMLDSAAIIRGIDMLVAAGADVRGAQGAQALWQGHYGESEAVMLHLLEQGAPPFHDSLGEREQMELLGGVIRRGWPRALAQLLRHELPEGWEQCGSYGFPDLLALVRDMRDAPAEHREDMAQTLLLMLRHGADPQAMIEARAPGRQNTSVADGIHDIPGLAGWLRERGVELARTPRPLRRESLVDDLGALDWFHLVDFHPPLDTLRPLYGDMARLLARVPDPKTEEARLHALTFMNQVDAARTVELVAALPAWESPEQAAALLRLCHRCRSLRLPADFLVRRATGYAEAGQALLAFELLRLLARDPANLATAERHCASGHPALAAAAWRVRLKLTGLVRTLGHYPPTEVYVPTELPRLERLVREQQILQLGMPPSYSAQGFENAVMYSGELQADALIALLREEGEAEAAGYLRDLLTLWELLRDDTPKPSDLLQPRPKRDQLLGQLRDMLRPERVTAAAIALETALARYVWAHRYELKMK